VGLLRDRALLIEKLTKFALAKSKILKEKFQAKHNGRVYPTMDFNDWEILFDVSEVDFESLSVFDEALFNPRNDNRSEASSDSSSYMS
jgi:hypothetical protein